MSDAQDFTQYAGQAVFPSSPEQLRDPGLCPACLTPHGGRPVCSVCRLDLVSPFAAELQAISIEAADAMLQRLQLIGRIRYESQEAVLAAQREQAEQRRAAAEEQARQAQQAQQAQHAQQSATAAAVHAEQPANAAGTTSWQSPGAGAPAAAAAQGAAAASAAAAPRRSGVQVLLVVIGVSLLSLFALGLLTYAFVFYGVLARSLILGALTVAVFVVAQLLRRRGLTVTGEGLAVVGMVLLAIDLWAIRANDFFGLAAFDGQRYFALCLLGTAVLYWLWHRFGGLRSASIVAAAQLVPGTILLVHSFMPRGWFLAEDLVPAFLAGATVVAVHWLLPREDARYQVERWILHGMGLASLVIAGLLSLELDGSSGWRVLALTAVAVIALAQALPITLRPEDRSWRLLAGPWWVLVTVAVALIPRAALSDTAAWPLAATLEQLAPVLLLVLAEWYGKHTEDGADAALSKRSAAHWVQITAIVMASAMALQHLLFAAGRFTLYVLGFGNGLPLLEAQPAAFYSILGLSIALLVLGIAWFLLGVLARRAVLFTALAVPIALVAPIALPPALGPLLGFLALAAALLTVLVLPVLRGSPRRRLVRIPVWIGFALAASTAYLVSHHSDLSWWIGAPAIMVLGLTLFLLARSGTAQLLLGIGSTLLLSLLALESAFRITGAPWQLLPALMVIMLGTWLLLQLLPLRVPGSAARDAAVWTALPIVAVFFAVSATEARHLAGFWALRLDLVLVLGAALALLGIAHGLRRSASAPLRTAAAAAGVTAAATVAALLSDHLGWPMPPGVLIASCMAVLATAVALALRLTPAGWLRPLAHGLELGALVAVLPVNLLMPGTRWIVLLLVAAALLLAALSRDGLFASASARKVLVWPAAAFATGAIWLQLHDHGVDTPEAYTLPLAGLLLVLAAALWFERLRLARKTPTSGRTPVDGQTTTVGAGASAALPWPALAGLTSLAALLALVPSVLASAEPGSGRRLWVGLAAAVLALACAWLPRLLQRSRSERARSTSGGRLVLLGVAVSAIVALALLSWVQLWQLHQGPTAVPGSIGAEFELWLWAPAAVVLLSLLGIATGFRLSGQGLRLMRAALIGVLIWAALATVLLAGTGTTALLRSLLLMLLLSAVIVIAYQLDRTPSDRPLGIAAAVIAAVSGLALRSDGTVEAVEWLSIPLALALLTAGWIRLDRQPQLRSWRALGIGLAVLLLPTLFSISDHGPVWRLVGLGIAATAVLVIGVVRRLQAPFLLGSIVLLTHLLVQGWPLITRLASEVPYFVWLGLAGVAVIWLAARYEQRVRDLKATVSRIRALR